MLATVERIAGGYVARFERHLNHPVEKVWAALTQPEKLANWLADAVIEELKEGGKIELTFSKTEGNVVVCTITEVKPHSVLEYTWGDDRVRWELYPKQDGCLLVLKQIFYTINDQSAKDLAGWHVHTDILLSVLEGQLVEFSYSRWEELYGKYTKMLSSQRKSNYNVLATVEKMDGGYVARFERHLNHPVEKVWAALTQPEKLSKWFADAVVDLKVGGTVELTFKPVGNTVSCTITEIQPQTVMEYTWGNDKLRWELYPKQDGCLLVLKEFFSVLDNHRPRDLSGWHTIIDMLPAVLDGEPVEFSMTHAQQAYDRYKEMLSQ
ncbi:SRPBCC family protein [Polycladomyces subterraneus]|uniref:SRPBCC family protein n=1 Tax=Polycladomyces subterraneus TaxID=1016997 RepID=A0ABT8IJR9_9BACL|nr:SRPBCC family protein [Polycladomyces subterraneus]MDN4593033.1 SRPBCC family protein [Polycladomyces subterraneus]